MWITHSLLMFVASVVLYLLIRKCQILNIPYQIYSIAMFGIPFIGFSVAVLFNFNVLHIPLFQILVSFIAAIFFIYLGNLFSMESIKIAPNPGYSLIISKSYVIFTTIVAYLLFHSEISLKNLLAILLIIAFSSLISISKSIRKSNLKWLILSIFAFFCWGLLALAFKYQIEQKVPLIARSFYLLLVVNILLIIETKLKRTSFLKFKPHFILIFAVGIFSGLLNIFMQFAYEVAPNPGYVNAVNATSIALLTILSGYFFKDELNLKKLLGVFGVTGGLILLFF